MLADLKATNKQGKENPPSDITHLNLWGICLQTQSYTTMAANGYQISYNKSGTLT